MLPKEFYLGGGGGSSLKGMNTELLCTSEHCKAPLTLCNIYGEVLLIKQDIHTLFKAKKTKYKRSQKDAALCVPGSFLIHGISDSLAVFMQ